MKKTAAIVLTLSLTAALAAGCGSKESSESPSPSASVAPTTAASTAPSASTAPAQGTYADGVYYAQGDDFDAKTGWKEVVGLKVESGKIVSVNWTAINKDGGIDKKEYSVEGKYGMKAGGASSEWHEQAAKAEAYLLEKQDPAAITFNDEGKTDAISGVSVHVNGLATLAKKALDAGAVEAGPYKDGTYKAEAADFDASSGWKDNVTLTVLNGKILAVQWNGTHKDGGTDKVTRSKSGEYGMKKGGASSEWHEQTAKAEAFVLEKQDPAAITVNGEGKTDAVSGVSIHVGAFVELAKKALEQAK
ncbi:FMN-binding protein [Gorillibacterium sp. CAU 1737]|uniref:FMN-binding protein n=1 Tax=Gorillibacterium sp. CAU 1737 TaxID=3140362 RepID=UPI003261A6DB